jgi:hypothetical protein
MRDEMFRNPMRPGPPTRRDYVIVTLVVLALVLLALVIDHYNPT